VATRIVNHSTFTVGTRRPGLGGIGRLIVKSDAIVLESRWNAKQLVVHERGPILVIRARFAPPWSRIGMILRGDTGSYGVEPLPGAGSNILAAIREAEFNTVERETWISRFPRSAFRA
jgi:hypothetical protein